MTQDKPPEPSLVRAQLKSQAVFLRYSRSDLTAINQQLSELPVALKIIRSKMNAIASPRKQAETQLQVIKRSRRLLRLCSRPVAFIGQFVCMG